MYVVYTLDGKQTARTKCVEQACDLWFRLIEKDIDVRLTKVEV